MGAIDRIKQFIGNQAISERKFFAKVGFAPGSFTSTKSIGSEKLNKIHVSYPDLNMDWIITDRGDMFLKDAAVNATCSTCLEWERKFNIEVQKNRDLLQEIRDLEKRK